MIFLCIFSYERKAEKTKTKIRTAPKRLQSDHHGDSTVEAWAGKNGGCSLAALAAVPGSAYTRLHSEFLASLALA